METPASELRREGRAKYFRELGAGKAFECNGNIWTKRSTRTAAGIWPACLPAWAYFGQNEVVYAQCNAVLEGAE